MIPEYLSPLANHLWQSTVFAAVAAALAFALRRNSARVRYCVWQAAAIKFLVPFSLLITVGQSLTPRLTVAPENPIHSVAKVSMPFAVAPESPITNVPRAPAPPQNPAPIILYAVWLCGFGVGLTSWMRSWLRARTLLHTATPSPIEFACDRSIRVMSSSGLLEPAVFGIFRPVLLLPEGIAGWLTTEQLRAVLIHESCHVRRRDNLASAIYMMAATVFWFYPLVRWIGSRLIDERERACDEEVLRRGGEPDVYAEGILNVCKFCLESSPVCAAGVMGSDLGKRVQAILMNRVVAKLDFRRKLLLVVAGAITLALPLLAGLVNAQMIGTPPQFEAASIKINNSGVRGTTFMVQPGGRLVGVNTSISNVIRNAYGIGLPFQLEGGPDWINSDRYDIEAKAEGNPSEAEVMIMVRSLLADRFKLKVHTESREMPAYILTVAKGGSKLKQTSEGSCIPRGAARPPRREGQTQLMTCGSNLISAGHWQAVRVDMASVAGALGALARRQVIDKTGLSGLFDIHLEYPLDPLTGSDSNAPSIFTLIQEELGLKLESGKAPAEVLVVDHIERPKEN